MMTDDGEHKAQRLQRLADIFSRHRMLLHDGPLFLSEVRTFFENLVGHGNLAEIVQVAAAAKGDERFVVEAEMFSKVRAF